MLGIGSWELEVGSWELGVGSWLGVGVVVTNTPLDGTETLQVEPGAADGLLRAPFRAQSMGLVCLYSAFVHWSFCSSWPLRRLPSVRAFRRGPSRAPCVPPMGSRSLV